MRKEAKLLVAAASLVLVGLLGYVLFSPCHKKTAQVTDEGATPSESHAAPETHAQAPAVNVTLAPATQPAPVTVALTPTTQPASPVVSGPAAIVPATDSNVAVPTATASGATDWSATLSTGTVATSTSSHAGALPSNTLIASAEAPLGASTTRTSLGVTSAATGGKTHKVVFGETISSIAAEYYGSKANYTKILAANPTVNPNHLKVGTVLTIPDLKADAAETTTASAGSAAVASGNTYAIKPGDSLQKIATKLYGSADKWQKIYELNRSTIGGDPHRLRAGMTIKLPEAPSATSAAAAH